VALILCWLAGLPLPDSFAQEFVSQDRHWVVTNEKFEIALRRSRLGKTPRIRTPVVLIHGLLVNSRFLDLTHNTSLAEYLAQVGFDVWNVSLRGTGRSLNPLQWGQKPWTLDDMVDRDLPAVIDYVKKETKSETVLLVGYELGGLLAFAYLGKNPGPDVAGLVSIAAPMTFDSPGQEPLKALLRLDENPNLKKFLLYVTVPVLGQFALPLFSNVEKVFYNPDNMDPLVKGDFLTTTLVPVNRGVLDQIIRMVQKGEAVSADGAISYRDALPKVRVPLLIVGGGEDPIAPPKALEKIYREVGSTDRELMIFWSDPEEDVSYGHFDLILGRKAMKEVFPLIRDWLELKATPSGDSSEEPPQ
jgi:pimeloyl-ACP methyl ester carboxylesterase